MVTKKQQIIDNANAVLSSYSFAITFREVYYQMVVRQMIDNNRSNYKMVSEALVFGRKAGLVPYEQIADDTREVKDEIPGQPFDVPSRVQHALDELDATIYISPAIYQQAMDVIFIEKEALVRVVENAFIGYRGYIFAACKGYNSLTHIKQIVDTFAKIPATVEETHVHYLGDHDPSGKDIERNLRDQLAELGAKWTSWERVAVLPEQIRQYNLPPLPPKDGKQGRDLDPRIVNWDDEGVGGTVELDAVDPNVLIAIVKKAVRSHWDKSVEEPCHRLSAVLTRHYQKRVISAFKERLEEEDA